MRRNESRWRSGRSRLRAAFTLVEVLITMAIMALTTYLAISFYNPSDEARRGGVQAQLEQLGQAVVLYNLNHPGQPFTATTKDPSDPIRLITWWTAIGPDFHDPKMSDPWGSPYEHDPGRGMVYSWGPNQEDDVGDGDDLFYYYRPPSAFVRDKIPSPDTTTNTAQPLISALWQFRGSTGVTTATVSVDGALVPDTGFFITASAAGSYWVSHTPSQPLAQGAHTVRMKAADGEGLVGRASWQFKVDTVPPVVYAQQPPAGQVTSFQAFPTTVYYKDVSGVAMSDAPGQESPILTVVSKPAGSSLPIGTYSGPTAIRANVPGTVITPGSLTIQPPSGGWPYGSTPYAFSVQLRDNIGNVMVPAYAWNFRVEDKTAPFLSVQLPAYASTLTSSNDADPVTVGVQVEVIGATEPDATVFYQVMKPDRNGTVVSQTGSQQTSADAFGQFRFPAVTIESSLAGAPSPTNTLILWAQDTQGNPGGPPPLAEQVNHLVFLYDEASSVAIEYAVASPQTTQPNKPMTFSVGATGGTTPYEVLWEFDDGYTLGAVEYSEYATSPVLVGVNSVDHTYIETGTYSVTVRVKDANGLEAAKLLSVYVGTESGKPDITLDPVPPEFAVGVPGADHTNFNISIQGKFLGAWRLRVDNSSATSGNFRWWYTGTNDWVTGTMEGAAPDASPTLWQQASSNNFSVEWFGTDNTDFGSVNEGDEQPPGNVVDGYINGFILNSFPGNNAAATAFGDVHIATLEYRDAFGSSRTQTAPIIVYNDIPQPSIVRIFSVDGDPNHPWLFDANFDGVWDYTRSTRVDLAIPQPPTSNNTDLWISNYPIDMHAHTLAHSNNPLTTMAVEIPQTATKNRGEVFQNFTLADGEFFDATDGSSGWTPHRPDGKYRNWDLTADMAALGYPGSSLPYPVGAPSACAPFGPSPCDPPQGAVYVAGSGLSLQGNGPKEVFAIFRSVGPFFSTQLDQPTGIYDSNPRVTGVTAAQIILDTLPPTSTLPIQLVDINVVKGSGGQEFVVGEFSLQADDSGGSGMSPRGRTIVSVPGQPDIVIPYSPQPEVTLGDFSTLSSGQGDLQVTATFVFEDNLGNRSSVVPSPNSSFSTIELTLIQYHWALTGSGDLRFFQATVEPDAGSTNIRSINHVEINASTLDSGTGPPFAPYGIQQWYAGVQGGVPEGAIDGARKAAETNIDPVNFPNPQDRLGVVQSVRAPDPGNPAAGIPGSGNPLDGVVEAQQTFPVEKDYCYLMQIEKPAGSGDIFYVVRRIDKTAAPGGLCLNLETQPAAPDGVVVASVNKVVNQASNRLNFGVIKLPRDIGASGTNLITGRLKDKHDHTTLLHDDDEVWDDFRDLIQSDDKTQVKTYTYRGVIGDFDSGTVGNIDYHLSVDNFRMRANFVSDPAPLDPCIGNPVLVDPGPADPPGVPRRLVRVRHFDNPACAFDPLNYGMGANAAGSAHFNNSLILDDPETPGGLTSPTGVGGSRFLLQFADQSNAFSWVTSGALSVGGYVQFSPSGNFSSGVDPNPPGTKYDAIFNGVNSPINELLPALSGNGAWHFLYKADGDVFPDSQLPIGGLVGDPFPNPGSNSGPIKVDLGDHPASVHLDWPLLDGQEGDLKAIFVYQDAQGNLIGPVQRIAQVDAKPPRIDVLQLEGRPPSQFVKYDYDPDSAEHEQWTSSSLIRLRVEFLEKSPLFREFVAGNQDNLPPNFVTATGAGAEVGCAAPSTVAGAGPPPCDVSNWHQIHAGSPAPAIALEPMEINLGAVPPTGFQTATFRFRDDFQNYIPVFTNPDDDGPANEAHMTTGVWHDPLYPIIQEVRLRTDDGNGAGGWAGGGYSNIRGGNPRAILVGGYLWTNEHAPRFKVEVLDPPVANQFTSSSGGSGFRRGGLDVRLAVGASPPAGVGWWPYLGGPSFRTLDDNTMLLTQTAINKDSCNDGGTCGSFTALDPDDDPATPAPELGSVHFQALARDSLHNVNTGGTINPTTPQGLPGTPNCAFCRSFAQIDFGFDNKGPTLIPAGMGVSVQHIPGFNFEEILDTLPVGAGTRQIPFPTQSFLDVSNVVISLGRGALGQGNEVNVTNVVLQDTITPAGPFAVGGGLLGLYDFEDPSTWTRSQATGPFEANRIDISYTGVMGTPLPIRIRVEGSRLGPSLTEVRPYQQPPVNLGSAGQTYPSGFTPVIGGTQVRVNWNQIDAGGVVTEAGVGVHQTLLADLSPTAVEWDIRRSDGGGAPQAPGPADPPTSIGNPAYLLDFTPYTNYAVIPQVRGLDRLENRGPYQNLLNSYVDVSAPNKVANLDVALGQYTYTVPGGGPAPRQNVRYTNTSGFSLAFTGVADQGGATPAQKPIYWVYRSLYPTAPDIDTGALVEKIVTSGTPDTGTPRSSNTNIAADGTEDALYEFSVFSEDQVGNRNTTLDASPSPGGGNRVRVLMDATPARIAPAPAFDTIAPTLVKRPRPAGVAKGITCSVGPAGECDQNWTNDPNLRLRFTAEDTSRNHAVVALQGRAGSGVAQVQFANVAGPAAETVTFTDAMTPTPSPGGAVVNGSAGYPHGYAFDIPIRAASLGGGSLPALTDVVAGAGRINLFARARDRALNAFSGWSPTFFHYDTAGPDIPGGGVVPGTHLLYDVTFCIGASWATCVDTPDLLINALGEDITVPANAFKMTVTWTLAQPTVTDPGYATELGAGFDPLDGTPPTPRYRWDMAASTTGTTNATTIVRDCGAGGCGGVLGNDTFRLYARDILGNEGPAVILFTALTDITPPCINLPNCDVTHVCQDGNCTIGGGLNVSSTANPPAAGEYLNIVRMQNNAFGTGTTAFAPYGNSTCPGPQSADDNDHFWISGLASDNSGIDMTKSGKLIVTMNYGGAAGVAYPIAVDIVGANGTDACFDFEDSGGGNDDKKATAIRWFARFPSPAYAPLAVPVNRWDHYGSGAANVTYSFQVFASDKGNNTNTSSLQYKRIDLRGPQGLQPTEYESQGGGMAPPPAWANILETGDGGGWDVDGVLPPSGIAANNDISGNPQIRMSQAGNGADVGTMSFQAVNVAFDAPGGTFSHRFAQVLGVENNNYELHMTANDIYANPSANEVALTGVRYDTKEPVSNAEWDGGSALETDCGAPTDKLMNVVCTDAFCTRAELEWDFAPDNDATSWVFAVAGSPGTVEGNVIDSTYGAGTNNRALDAGNPEWRIFGAAYDVTKINQRYTFRTRAFDAAGNAEVADLPATSLAGDAQYLVSSYPGTTPLGWTIEEVGGWVDAADNADGPSGGGWEIVGDWASCEVPSLIEIQIKINNTLVKWNSMGAAGWVDITNTGDPRIVAGSINGGAPTGTWNVQIAPGFLAGEESNDVDIEVRLTNSLGTSPDTGAIRNTKADTVLPTITLPLNNWEPAASGWVDRAQITDAGGWTINGTFVESFLDPAYPQIQVVETAAGQTALNPALNVFTLTGTGAGTWTYTWPAANFNSPFEVENDGGIRINLNIQDQAGNTGSTFRAGLQLDAKLPVSVATLNTAPPGCGVVPALDVELACTDGYCRRGTIQWDDSGSYANMTVPVQVGPSNPVNDDPTPGNSEWLIPAGQLIVAGKTYKFRSIAEDMAGNLETSLPTLPANDFAIAVADVPSGTFSTWEESGGWIDATDNADNSGWELTGTWTSCAVPTLIEIQVKIGGTLTKWDSLDTANGWIDITNIADARIVAGAITGTNPTGGWNVTLAPSLLNNVESTDVDIEIRLTNVIGTSAAIPNNNRSADTVAPTITLPLNNWEPAASGWVDRAQITDAGGWTINGTFVETFLNASYPQIQVVETAGGPTALNPALNVFTTTGSGAGTWTYTWPAANFNSPFEVENDGGIRINLNIQDQAGNTGSTFRAGLQLDAKLPTSVATLNTAPPGCGVVPALNVELACTDGYCRRGTLQWDDLGSYANMAVPVQVGPSNPINDDPTPGNSEWLIPAGQLPTAGKTYKFRTIAEDLAGNLETGGALPTLPANDFAVSVADVPTGSYLTWEESGGWIDATDNADNLGWEITGDWTSCAVPTLIEIQVKINNTLTKWNGLDAANGWIDITNTGDARIVAGAITGTNPTGGWNVTLAPALLNNVESTDVDIEIRITNVIGTSLVIANNNRSADTVLPTFTIATWEKDAAEGDWVNINSNTGGWTITGTRTEAFPNNGTFQIRVSDGGPDLTPGLTWATVGTPAGWSHTFASGALTGGNARDNKANCTIEVRMNDLAGNLGTGSQNPIKVDTVRPSGSSVDNTDAAEPVLNCAGAQAETFTQDGTCANTWELRWEKPLGTIATIGARQACGSTFPIGAGSFNEFGTYSFVSIAYDQAGNSEASKDPPSGAPETEVEVHAAPAVTFGAVEETGGWVDSGDVAGGNHWTISPGTWDGGPLDNKLEIRVTDGTNPLSTWNGGVGPGWFFVDQTARPEINSGSSGTITNGNGSWNVTLNSSVLTGIEGIPVQIEIRLTSCGVPTVFTLPVNVDTVAPQAVSWNYAPPGGAPNWVNDANLSGSWNISGDVTDGGSGIDGTTELVSIVCSGGTIAAASAPMGPGPTWNHIYMTGGSLDGDEDTNCKIRMTVDDMAGNSSGNLDSNVHGAPQPTFDVDTLAPTGDVTVVNTAPDASGWHNIAVLAGGLQVSGSIAEAGSGLASAAVVVNGGGAGMGVPEGILPLAPGPFSHTFGAPIFNNDDMDLGVNIRVTSLTDNAGNTGSPGPGQMIQVDTVVPADPLVGINAMEDGGFAGDGPNIAGCPAGGPCNPFVDGVGNANSAQPGDMIGFFFSNPATNPRYNRAQGAAPGAPTCTTGTPGSNTGPLHRGAAGDDFAVFLNCDQANNPSNPSQGHYQTWQ